MGSLFINFHKIKSVSHFQQKELTIVYVHERLPQGVMWPQANTQGDFNQKLEKKGVAFA